MNSRQLKCLQGFNNAGGSESIVEVEDEDKDGDADGKSRPRRSSRSRLTMDRDYLSPRKIKHIRVTVAGDVIVSSLPYVIIPPLSSDAPPLTTENKEEESKSVTKITKQKRISIVVGGTSFFDSSLPYIVAKLNYDGGGSKRRIEDQSKSGNVFGRNGIDHQQDATSPQSRMSESDHQTRGATKKRKMNDEADVAVADCNKKKKKKKGHHYHSIQMVNMWNLQWEERRQQLVEYKEEFGHSNVPKFNPQNKALGHWVHNQRSTYHNRSLKPYRIESLTKIGFNFDYGSLQEGNMYYPKGGVGKQRLDEKTTERRNKSSYSSVVKSQPDNNIRELTATSTSTPTPTPTPTVPLVATVSAAPLATSSTMTATRTSALPFSSDDNDNDNDGIDTGSNNGSDNNIDDGDENEDDDNNETNNETNIVANNGLPVVSSSSIGQEEEEEEEEEADDDLSSIIIGGTASDGDDDNNDVIKDDDLKNNDNNNNICYESDESDCLVF